MSRRIFLILFFLFAVNFVHAEDLYFRNVLSGGYAEKIIELNVTFLNFSVEGQVKDWIRMSPLQDSRLRVSVAPPYGTPNGNYSANIKISGHVVNRPMTTAIQYFLETKAFVEITDEEVEQARISELVVSDAEKKGPVKIRISISNEGNLPITLLVYSAILSEDKKELFNHSFTIPLIMATKEFEGSEMIYHNLSKGAYLANITVSSHGLVLRSQLSRFRIVDKLPEEAKTNNTSPEPVALSSSFFLLFWAGVGVFIIWSITKRISKMKDDRIN